MLTDSLIETILTSLPGKTIGVLGDLFLDRYLDIDASLTEPSIETGLDAYQVVRFRSYPGALGTVINNLAALGVGHIYPVAVIGDDGEGYELRQALRGLKVVEPDGVSAWAGRRTPTYTKPMLHEAGKPPRELNRLDIKNRTPTPTGAEEIIIASLGQLWSQCDAWIMLDQVSEVECGVVTRRVREYVAHLSEGDPEKFVLADSRERVGDFHEVSVKPNWNELSKAVGGTRPADVASDADAVEPVVRLAAKVGGTVFCTRGERSTLVVQRAPNGGGWQIAAAPAYPAAGPIDTVGAGDSVSAGIACAMVCGATAAQAAAFGNLLASITVQQIGTTGSASPAQVRSRWRQVFHA